MNKITRRTALVSSVSLAGATLSSCDRESTQEDVEFLHGVASGDPTTNSVILWTRISPAIDGPVKGRWEISEKEDFSKTAKKGKFNTRANRDYTVKIDATGLKSGGVYFYRFKVGKSISATGRTKTLPAGAVNSARFAVVSCSNYQFGYFNAYDHIAQNPDFDAVIHLGDYLYEHGHDGYGGSVGKQIGRLHEPAHEILSLADYRARHGQYKSDPASMAMHAQHPLICIWDDHETANNSWKTGAENHNPGEGSWDDRRANAMQAYYEWMPVRDPAPGHPREALFKNYKFGDLLSITAIETRLTARHRPIDYVQYIPDFQTREGVQAFVQDILGDPGREMLGGAQKEYIADTLQTSVDDGHAWRLIANQVIMARTASPDLSDYKDADFIDKIAEQYPQIRDYIALSPLGLPLNPDAWDGYPAARENFYQTVRSTGVSDLLVLTGDTHESWANRLISADGTNMGVELGATSVTSPSTGAYFGDAGPDFSKRLQAKNDDILYHDLEHHGYIDLILGRQEGRADFIAVSTIHKPDYEAFVMNSMKLFKSDNHIDIAPV